MAIGGGSELAGYRIVSLLGRGGAGTVHLAEDLRLGRKVSSAGASCGLDNPLVEIDRLPGHDLILAGIEDLENGRRTPESLLVSIGAERLRAAGLDVPVAPPADGFPEHALYDLLASDEPESAHGRYNALLRRLVSFERALEHARAR